MGLLFILLIDTRSKAELLSSSSFVCLGLQSSKLDASPAGLTAATVSDAVKELAATVGENVRLRRAFRLESPSGIVASYLHTSPQPGMLSQVACTFSIRIDVLILNSSFVPVLVS